MLLVSIIVPIYNVERYIRCCVDRLINQSYRNIEIILVDDGSPDNCPIICDEYAKNDERIKVIHKSNGGLSDARNAGVKIATGDYIMFIDSDDYWKDNEVLKKLVRLAESRDVDVINFGHCSVYEGSDKEYSHWVPYNSHNQVESALDLTTHHSYRSSACMKMIRACIVKENPVFEKGRLSEDIVWSANILSNARTFVSVPEVYYCHLIREHSITNSMTIKSCDDLCYAIEKCVEIAQNANAEKRIPLFRYAAYQLGTFVIVQSIIDDCTDYYIDEMKAYSWLFKYHAMNIRVCGLYILNVAFGFKQLCQFIRKIKKLRMH